MAEMLTHSSHSLNIGDRVNLSSSPDEERIGGFSYVRNGELQVLVRPLKTKNGARYVCISELMKGERG